MFLSGAVAVACDEYYKLINEACELRDNRFAVINGLMFELSEVGTDDGSFASLVGVFDATDVNNPSDGQGVTAAYGHYIGSVGFLVNAQTDTKFDYNEAKAEKQGQALFVHMITLALTDFVELRERIANLSC